jgi:hypothetical protein
MCPFPSGTWLARHCAVRESLSLRAPKTQQIQAKFCAPGSA